MKDAPAKKHKLGYRLAQSLARDIIASGWKVGANLGRESELMEKYGVSRDPLREALRILEWQGVARSVPGPGGGLKVQKPARDAIVNLLRDYILIANVARDDVIEAARTLNTMAVGQLVAHVDAGGIAQLESAIAAGRTLRPTLAEEARHQVNVFILISRLTRNPTLSLFIQPVNEVLINFFDMSIQPSPETIELGKPSWVFMRNTVRAIGHRDTDEAVANINRYIDHLKYCLDHQDRKSDGINQTPFWVMERKSNRAQAFIYQLSGDIRKKDLKPGDRIGLEPELIENYQVSRSVLREAIRMLEFIGVVQQRKGRVGGLFVAEPDPSLVVAAVNMYMKHSGYNFHELQESKLVIEEKAAFLAAEKLSVADARALSTLSNQLRNASRDNFIECSAELIYMIARAAHNPIISLYLETIMEASIYSPLEPEATDRLLSRLDDVKLKLVEVAGEVLSHNPAPAAAAMVRYRRLITELTSG